MLARPPARKSVSQVGKQTSDCSGIQSSRCLDCHCSAFCCLFFGPQFSLAWFWGAQTSEMWARLDSAGGAQEAKRQRGKREKRRKRGGASGRQLLQVAAAKLSLRNNCTFAAPAPEVPICHHFALSLEIHTFHTSINGANHLRHLRRLGHFLLCRPAPMGINSLLAKVHLWRGPQNKSKLDSGMMINGWQRGGSQESLLGFLGSWPTGELHKSVCLARRTLIMGASWRPMKSRCNDFGPAPSKFSNHD